MVKQPKPAHTLPCTPLELLTEQRNQPSSGKRASTQVPCLPAPHPGEGACLEAVAHKSAEDKGGHQDDGEGIENDLHERIVPRSIGARCVQRSCRRRQDGAAQPFNWCMPHSTW